MDQADRAVATDPADVGFELTRPERRYVALRVLLARMRRPFRRSWRFLDQPRLVDVQPREGYRLWCRFNDGVAGIIDLSDLAAAPYCRRWGCEPGFFESVVIDGGALRWDEDIDVCYDVVRARLLGLPPEATLDDIWGDCAEVPRAPAVVFAKALSGFRIGCVFADGTRGVADFSDWSANGKFERWRTEEGFFESVRVRSGGLSWDAWVDIWSDHVYERVIGRRLGRGMPSR